MIDEEKTLIDFEYMSNTLTRGSHAYVYRICESCGKSDKVEYKQYASGYRKCSSCAHKNIIYSNRGPFNIEYFQSLQNSINDGHINELRTFDEFQYYSIDLTYGSTKHIYRICQICKKKKL
jgi:hypothetical protein